MFNELHNYNDADFIQDWAKQHKAVFAKPSNAELLVVQQILAIPHFQVLISNKAILKGTPVDDAYSFEFHPQAYAPSRDYDLRFGQFAFRKHYYSRIGDFDSKEEFECAVWLDMQAQKGRIDFWVRNLVRKEGCSFFLQKADGRFYPDFLCKLPGGVNLAVEYKGANQWTATEDDRLIGGLWEELSDGRCRFVMATEKDWSRIDAKL